MACQQLGERKRKNSERGWLNLVSCNNTKTRKRPCFQTKTSQPFILHTTEADRGMLRELDWILKSPLNLRCLHIHSFKRKQNRARGIAEKYLCIGREGRGDCQAGENTKPFSLSLLLTVPLIHWSQEHTVLEPKSRRLEMYPFGYWWRNVVAAVVVWITFRQ